jgi:hypothetical protein
MFSHRCNCPCTPRHENYGEVEVRIAGNFLKQNTGNFTGHMILVRSTDFCFRTIPPCFKMFLNRSRVIFCLVMDVNMPVENLNIDKPTRSEC